MQDIKGIITKKVKKVLDKAIDGFASGLVNSPDHPVVTGITRGNWHSSVGAEVALENLYGYEWSDIYDASTLGEVLVSVGDAYKTSSNVKYSLGDKIFWTNSLDHIGELELRRKFFDLVVHNAVQQAKIEAQGA